MRSSYIGPQFWLDYCKRVFGETYTAPDIAGTNKLFGGLDINATNIFFINASEDPWQWASMRTIHDPVN